MDLMQVRYCYFALYFENASKIPVIVLALTNEEISRILCCIKTKLLIKSVIQHLMLDYANAMAITKLHLYIMGNSNETSKAWSLGSK